MIAKLPLRRPALVLALALSLGALAVAALLGPTRTLAQTHKAANTACPSSGKHVQAKRGHGCAKPARTPRGTGKSKSRRAAKHRVKRAHAKTKGQKSPASSAFVPARCEDGSAPVAGANGSFSCDDGSEPRCEDGATPTRSSNGQALLCAAPAESGAGAAGEAECEEREEEESLSCTVSAGEEICEVPETSSGCEAAS